MTEYCNSHGYQKDGQCSCGCGCGRGCSCGCGSNLHHHHHSEDGCGCAENFLKIADEAWVELLKEKIKAKIIAKKGEHIEKLAEIIAKANGEKWKTKLSGKTHCNEYKETLKEFFTHHEE